MVRNEPHLHRHLDLCILARLNTITDGYLSRLAFLTPGIIYFLLPFLLWYLTNKLVKYPPDGSALTKVWKITTVAFKYNKGNVFKKGFWDTAKPSNLRERGVTTFRNVPISAQWTDKDAEVRSSEYILPTEHRLMTFLE